MTQVIASPQVELPAPIICLQDGIISALIPMRKLNAGKDGKQLLILPAGTTAVKHSPNPMLIKALARAYLWQQMLQSGKYGSAGKLAKKLKVSNGYMRQILALNWLAPHIRKSIFDGTQPRTLNMQMLKGKWSEVWGEQLRYFGFKD